MKYIHFPFVLLTILLACNLFTACNDDEGGGFYIYRFDLDLSDIRNGYL